MVSFRKIFFTVILLFFSFNLNLYAEIINKIKVKGNQRISVETIAVFGDIILGKNYESQDVSLIIKKLYETTFFSNISATLDNGQLNLIVEENPIINSVIFEGEKANKYKRVLSELLTLREKSSYVSGYIKSDINLIKDFYRELGFYFIKIDAQIKKLDSNRVNVIYTLDKGEKAKISKIYFLGDKIIRDNKLRSIITSQESQFWKIISKNVYLNKGRIELDKRLLKSYYKNIGYYEVKIVSSNVEYSEGVGFVLTFSIDAGQRYKFKKIYANVDDGLDKLAFASLEEEFSQVVGKYYSEKKLASILEEIDELTQQKELQYINHSIEETLTEDTIEVKINIFEGEKFLIERIDIVGNNVTNDDVIRSEMLVDEGDPYSDLLVNKSVNQLKARNLFSDVKKTITEGSAPDLKVLEIKVDEKATGEIMAGAGVGTDGTSFMFSVNENNWLGRGVSLTSSVNVSKETFSGSLSVSNPNFNYTGNEVFSSVYLATADLSTSSGYESSKSGVTIGTGFEQYRDVWISASLAGNYEDVEVKSTSSVAVKKMEGTYSNIDLSYGVTFDQRDQAFETTRGYYAKWSQTLPLLIDSSSITNGIDAVKYHGFSDDVVGKVKFYARSIHGVSDEDVRLTNRLFLPAKKLRGFNVRKTGPKDGNDWVGGNYVTALGFEANLPNLIPEALKTDISLFVDTGNVWGVDYSDSISGTNTIRTAVGVAANVLTTVGPLSFTFAQNISKSKFDDTQFFNFRLGTSF